MTGETINMDSSGPEGCCGCFPLLKAFTLTKRKSNGGEGTKSKSPAASTTSDRQGLLEGAAQAKSDEEDIQSHLDLRRVFSRADISAIPEHTEVNKGADTNREASPTIATTVPTIATTVPTITAMAEPTAKPPPSPLPGPPPQNLERLFSRGASRNSPVSLNRMFSRGAVPGRTGSGLSGSGSWTQRAYRASTTDSRNDDYGEDTVETLTDVSASPLIQGKSGLSSVKPSPTVTEVDEKDTSRLNEPAAVTIVKQSSSGSGRIASRRRFPELIEALKKLQPVSDHLVVATLRADTRDHQDHTFSGIFFDVEARRLLPAEFIEIQSISIRGDLGEVSVYSSERTFEGKHGNPNLWVRHFGPLELTPSRTSLFELILNVPIRLAPGTTRGIYIHSELQGDMAIVYDDLRSHSYTYEDNIIRIHPGMAHTSHVPFAPQAPWGGSSYRRHREFVGSMRYGVKLLLWTPEVHHHFPRNFRHSVCTLMCCHHVLNKNGVSVGFGRIPKDVLFYVINMLSWDWFPGVLEEESDLEEEPEQEFQYGGHVGRIAQLRQLFDEARQQTNGETPVPARTQLLTDSDVEDATN